MIRFEILLCCCFLMFVGCGKEAPPMQQDLLVNILTDVHVVEGLLMNHTQAKLRDSMQVVYMDQVLDTWGVSEKEFETALNHLHRAPDYMTDIYDLVRQKVSEMSTKIDEEEGRDEFKQLE